MVFTMCFRNCVFSAFSTKNDWIINLLVTHDVLLLLAVQAFQACVLLDSISTDFIRGYSNLSPPGLLIGLICIYSII